MVVGDCDLVHGRFDRVHGRRPRRQAGEDPRQDEGLRIVVGQGRGEIGRIEIRGPGLQASRFGRTGAQAFRFQAGEEERQEQLGQAGEQSHGQRVVPGLGGQVDHPVLQAGALGGGQAVGTVRRRGRRVGPGFGRRRTRHPQLRDGDVVGRAAGGVEESVGLLRGEAGEDRRFPGRGGGGVQHRAGRGRRPIRPQRRADAALGVVVKARGHVLPGVRAVVRENQGGGCVGRGRVAAGVQHDRGRQQAQQHQDRGPGQPPGHPAHRASAASPRAVTARACADDTAAFTEESLRNHRGRRWARPSSSIIANAGVPALTASLRRDRPPPFAQAGPLSSRARPDPPWPAPAGTPPVAR